MMIEIKQTVSFAYPIGSAKPTIVEIANFVKALDSNPGDIDTVYRIGEEKAVFVKYKNEASMRYALSHNPEQLTFHYANGTTVEVRMSLAGGLTEYVRVYDLPPEVSDATVGTSKIRKNKTCRPEEIPKYFEQLSCTVCVTEIQTDRQLSKLYIFRGSQSCSEINLVSQVAVQTKNLEIQIILPSCGENKSAQKSIFLRVFPKHIFNSEGQKRSLLKADT